MANLQQLELWERDFYLSSWAEEIRRTDLLSLDIFDTLLFRTCSVPSDIFYEVGKQALVEKSLNSVLTPIEFQSIRTEAESVARKNRQIEHGTSEINLDHIYKEIPERVGDLQRIKLLEVEVEKRFAFLNPSIMSLVKYCNYVGIKIVLVSNMYLSSKYIEEILVENGFDLNYIDDLIVSNEEKVDKSSGELFRVMLKRFPSIDKDKIIHIGDNKISDIDGANKVGIHSIHYPVITKDFNSIFEWEHILHGDILPQLKSLRKIAGSITYKEERNFWYTFGATILGPLLSVFSDWLVDICINEGKKEIYPYMREGSLLSKIIKKTAENRKVELIVKPLFVSRQSTFLAGVSEFNQEVLDSFFERRKFTLKNLFDTLNLTDELKQFYEYKNIYLHESHKINVSESINLKETLINYFNEKSIQQAINKNIEKERELLVGYLEQTSESFNNILTVDLGFEGTIQRAIENALSNKKVDFKITHTLIYGGEKNKQHLVSGIDVRGFAGNAGENIDLIKTIIRSSDLIEQLLMEDYGSTIHYKINGDGTIYPVLEDNSLNKSEKSACQEGIFFFQQLWLNLSRCKPELRYKLFKQKRGFVQLLHRVITMPILEEAEKLGSLNFDENFGSKTVSVVCTNKDSEMLEKLGVEKFLKISSSGYRVSEVAWPEGVISKKYPNYFLQYYLEHNAPQSYLVKMLELIKQVASDNVSEIMIYGAGEAGSALLKVAELYNINVIYFIDRKESLWGEVIDGIKVISLDEAIKNGSHYYAIGSFSFAEQIKSEIRYKYEKTGVKPMIYTVFK